MRHDGGGRFKADVSGETQFGTSFDISFDAPLAVQLNAYRNSGTADELLQWFDRFLRQGDFVFSQEKRGEDLYLRGAVRWARAIDGDLSAGPLGLERFFSENFFSHPARLSGLLLLHLSRCRFRSRCGG